jgi:hypothetical protein
VRKCAHVCKSLCVAAAAVGSWRRSGVVAAAAAVVVMVCVCGGVCVNVREGEGGGGTSVETVCGECVSTVYV